MSNITKDTTNIAIPSYIQDVAVTPTSKRRGSKIANADEITKDLVTLLTTNLTRKDKNEEFVTTILANEFQVGGIYYMKK